MSPLGGLGPLLLLPPSLPHLCWLGGGGFGWVLASAKLLLQVPLLGLGVNQPIAQCINTFDRLSIKIGTPDHHHHLGGGGGRVVPEL
jgi:hypothetical protein